MRRYLTDSLRKIFTVDMEEDSIKAIQIEAIKQNQLASEDNVEAAKRASEAITDLLKQMEASRNVPK